MLPNLIVCLAIVSQICDVYAVKLTPISSANLSLDLFKKAETVTSAIEQSATKINRANTLDRNYYALLESSEVQGLITEIGEWLKVEKEITKSRRVFSKGQIKSFNVITNVVTVGRIAVAMLLRLSGGSSIASGIKEEIEVCPSLLSRSDGLSYFEAQMWMECAETLSGENLPLQDSVTNPRGDVIISARSKIPWFNEITPPDGLLTAVDFTTLAEVFRSAWDVAEDVRSRFLKALPQLLLQDGVERQAEVLNRLQAYAETSVNDFTARQASQSIANATSTAADSVVLNTFVLSTRLAEEIQREAALFSELTQALLADGAANLKEYHDDRGVATVGFLPAHAVAALFRTAYLRLESESTHTEYLKAPPKAQRKTSTSSGAKTASSTSRAQQQRERAEAKARASKAGGAGGAADKKKKSSRTRSDDPTRPQKPTTRAAPPSPPLSTTEWLVSWLTCGVALLLTSIAVAAAGGGYIRTTRAKLQKFARAKKEQLLRPMATAGTTGRLTARNFHIGMPLTSLVAKLDSEIPLPTPPYHVQIQSDIVLFASESVLWAGQAWTALLALLYATGQRILRHKAVVWCLDYVDGKPVTTPGALLAAVVAPPTTTSIEDDLQMMDSAPVVSTSARASNAAKKARHHAKSRRATRARGRSDTTDNGAVQSISQQEHEGQNYIAGDEGDEAEADTADATEDVDETEIAKVRNASFDSVLTGDSLDAFDHQALQQQSSPEGCASASAVRGQIFDDAEFDAELLEELMEEERAANAAAYHPPDKASEGEWISTGGAQGRRSRSGSQHQQSQFAKQLHRQQLIRKTTEARFLQQKAANKADAQRSGRWDRERERERERAKQLAGAKRMFTGVPNPMTVSPDTVVPSASSPPNFAVRNGPHQGRTDARPFFQPIPMRFPNVFPAGLPASASRARMQNASAANHRHNNADTQTRGIALPSGMHMPADEGEQSSLTDSDMSEGNTNARRDYHSVTNTVNTNNTDTVPGNFPVIPQHAEPNTVLQYCAMLQHYYRRQVSLMSSLGWTYVMPAQVPMAQQQQQQSEYAPVYTAAPQAMGPAMVLIPRVGIPMMDNANFPPLSGVHMAPRVHGASIEYFQQNAGVAPAVNPPYAYAPVHGVQQGSAPLQFQAYYSAGGQLHLESVGAGPFTTTVPDQQATPGVLPQVVVQLTVEEEELVMAVQKQIEYYFSAENLIYDTYLRNLMDGDGFVDLTEIAQFRRIVRLAPSAHLLLIAIHGSELLEVKEDPAPTLAQLQDFHSRLVATKIRPSEEPLRWVLQPDGALGAPVSPST